MTRKSDSERLRVLLLFCYFKRILQEKQEQNEPRSDSYSMCLMFHDMSRSLLNLQVALLEEFNPVLSSCNFLCSLLSCKSVNFVLVANSMFAGQKWSEMGSWRRWIAKEFSSLCATGSLSRQLHIRTGWVCTKCAVLLQSLGYHAAMGKKPSKWTSQKYSR